MQIPADLWREIAARPRGPLAFRFYLQPLMAILLAVRDGIRDARANRPPAFWDVLTRPRDRRPLFEQAWQSIRRVFYLAFLLDLIYQLVVLHGLRPLQGMIVAVWLALLPYAALRGPANRVARLFRRHGPRPAS